MRFTFVVIFLMAFAVTVNSRLILPDINKILNSDVPPGPYGERSECETLTLKLGLKLSKLVWDVLNDFNQLLPGIKELLGLIQEAFVVCFLS